MISKHCVALHRLRPTTLAAAQRKQPAKFTKTNLPSKVCPVCGRPFEWRKKWEKVWDSVKYCSERCRRRRADAKEELVE